MQITREIAERIHSELLEAQKQAAAGNPAKAKDICLAALKQCPEHPDAHQVLGLVLLQERSFGTAAEHLSKSLEVVPGQPHLWMRLGLIRKEQGILEEAVAAFDKALSLDPGNGHAWRLLAGVAANDRLDDLVIRIKQRLLDEPGIEVQLRLQLLFALAKACMRLEKTEQALDFAAIAKHIQERLNLQGEEHLAAMFAAIRDTFTPDLLSKEVKEKASDPIPVFVVGLPFSGQDAVEAALSAGKGVAGAGEAPAMDIVMRALVKKAPDAPFPHNIGRLGEDDLADLGALYYQTFSALPAGTTHVVDRLPANLHVLGLVRMILPDARVVYVRRDPLDTCLSILTEYFPESSQPQFSSVKGIGMYAALCRDLMALWQEQMPGFIQEVSYEALLSDPRKEVARMMDFCGIKQGSEEPVFGGSGKFPPQGLGKKFSSRLWQFEEAFAGKPAPSEAEIQEMRETLERARKVVVEDNLSRADKLAGKVLKAHPHQADAMQIKALAAVKKNDFDGAAEWYRKSLDAAPIQPSVWIKFGQTQFAARNVKDARYALEVALNLDPANTEALALLGTLHLGEGNQTRAKEYLERVIAIDPGYSTAYNFLMQIEGFVLSPAALARLREIADSDQEKLERTANAAFVLATHFRKQKDNDNFIRYVKRANQLQAKVTTKLVSYGQLFSDSQKLFTRDFLEDSLPPPKSGPVPVFIVGLPRSGSTLIEQILGSHKQVFPADEIHILKTHLVTQTQQESGEPYPESLLHLSKASLQKIASAYLGRMKEISATHPFITDKMLSNVFYVGLIRKCLPHAKVIYAKRNLMDTAFSIYTNSFTESLNYTYNLEAMAGYARQTVDIMRFWKRLMPGFVLDVQYEQVVAEPEKQVRRILDFCGLEWDPACLEFHKSKRPALTLSITQVQKPIYKSSVGKWKPYAELLEPFRKGIEDLIDEDGFLKS